MLQNNLKIFLGILIMISSLNAESKVTTSDKDPMTNVSSCYVSSNYILATKTLEFPYQKLAQSINVGINSEGEEWIYFAFPQDPNLNDDLLTGQYQEADRKIRFDKEIITVRMQQELRGRFVYLVDDKKILIEKLMKSKALFTSQKQYGNGMVYYDHNLKGFTKAYNEARKKCGLKPY